MTSKLGNFPESGMGGDFFSKMILVLRSLEFRSGILERLGGGMQVGIPESLRGAAGDFAGNFLFLPVK